MEQENNRVKAVLTSAELGAQGLSKDLDMQLRMEEEKLRNKTKVEDTVANT